MLRIGSRCHYSGCHHTSVAVPARSCTAKREANMTVIAMTREIGSHGSEVAAGVAAALGLEIINSEIVVPHVAETLGVEQSAVQRYLNGKASFFDRWQIDTRKLSQHTLDQILNLALKDNVLIRGWGAAALFQDRKSVVEGNASD